MINIFGVPIIITPFSKHQEVKEEFLDYLEKDEYFSKVSSWKCSVESTFCKDNNFDLPWNTFIENAIACFNEYLSNFPIEKQFQIEIYAWLNRYSKGHNQEVHNHAGGNSVLSCAYMLELPENSGDIVFFQTGNDLFKYTVLNDICNNNLNVSNRFTPVLNEGDIIIFPSYLDHYVTGNNTDQRRSTISANLYINPI